MNPLNPSEVVITMSISLFLLGAITFVTGMVILLTRTFGKEISGITSHTRQLAQKGLAQNIAGLVGNASALLTAANEMARTSAGLGVLLLVFGLVQIAASIGIVLYINGG